MTSADIMECLSNKNKFLSLVVDSLGNYPTDFMEKMNFVQSAGTTGEEQSAAGVLLLLHFRSNDRLPIRKNGEFFFQLIKRSAKVTQPGDLSCPGGLLNNHLDPLLRPLLMSNFISILQGDALKYLQMRDADTLKTITIFLTNAIREAWEETGLKPWNILFLGPLPSYSLYLFKRTIFPLVCFVKKDWNYQLNPEVEKIIEIPLTTFFDEIHYGRYNIETSKQLKKDNQEARQFPCLIIHDKDGNEEILWGATFYIIVNFLKIIFNFEIPDLSSKIIIKRTLGPEYLKGILRSPKE